MQMTMPAAAGRDALRFNPLDPAFRRDPYPVYARLREEAPYLRTLGTLVLSRHRDVTEVLKSRQFSVDLIPQTITRHAAKLGVGPIDQVERFIRSSIVFTDNPQHVRLRQLVNQAYPQSAIAALVPRIRGRVERLLDAGTMGAPFDFVRDLAAPLPIHVLCDWMGVPEQARNWIGRHVHVIRFLLDPGLMSRSDLGSVVESLRMLTAYFVELAGTVSSRDDGNLVSRLCEARSGGERLSDEEVAFACVMSFVAGTETTQCLIGNAVNILIDHPHHLAELRRHPQLATAAIEEAIRYETPLQMTKRVASTDLKVGDTSVRAGEQILLCLAAANRDHAAFDAPDRYEPGRKGPPHVGFGYGMHACLGGALARIQGEAALTVLVDRYAEIHRHAGPPVWQSHSLILRGPDALPVVLIQSR